MIEVLSGRPSAPDPAVAYGPALSIRLEATASWPVNTSMKVRSINAGTDTRDAQYRTRPPFHVAWLDIGAVRNGRHHTGIA